jgi:hypothetical protein
MDNSTNFQDETKSEKMLKHPPSSHRLPQVRKSALNMEKLILKSKTIKRLSFNERNEVCKTKNSDSLKNLIIENSENSNDSLKNLIIENNNSDYKNHTIETRSYYSTSKFENEESSERPKNQIKRNVLQNLLYLYDQEINKMKLNTDRKYSRNKTNINVLKGGLKSSVIKLNDREIAMFESINKNAKEVKYDLMEKSIGWALGKIDDVLYKRHREKKKVNFYNFLKYGFKNTILNYIKETIYNIKDDEHFQIPGPKVNFNINFLIATRLNGMYYEIGERVLVKTLHQDYILDEKPIFDDSIESIKSDDELFKILSTHETNNRGSFAFFKQIQRKSLFSYRNFFRNNPNKSIPHPGDLGYSNITYYNENLKRDQQEIEKSQNSTRDMINKTSSDEDSVDFFQNKMTNRGKRSSIYLPVTTPGIFTLI